MEKTLIILIGNARGGEDTWKTMYDNLRDPYNADIALCFGKNSNKNSSLYKNAKFIWEMDEYENWYDYYSVHFKNDWFKWLEKHKPTGLLGGINDSPGSGSIIFAFRHFVLNNYKDILNQYDRIILTRSDYYYINRHPILPIEYFHIVEGEDYGGLTDRHHIFNKSMINDVLGVCEFMCDEENFEMLHNQSDLNPEKLLKLFFIKTGIFEKIRRCHRVQFTVADSNDTTRWQKPGPLLPGHRTLRLKYTTEYNVAIANKNLH
jgi:hypothetical protein